LALRSKRRTEFPEDEVCDPKKADHCKSQQPSTALITRNAEVLKAAAAAAGPLPVMWKLRKAATIGLGAVVTAVAVVAGQPIASALSGLAATVVAMVMQAAVWVQRSVRRLAAA
jgi:hypothetical protein